ncbi:hypothetical protein ACFFGH_31155 [Lysobacter korlensis]|uniref:Uncharacterized protein n=1 Tax=Lysobacter korlensis TaxID=553636 RepID=A0ABV6RZA5_9GAMM
MTSGPPPLRAPWSGVSVACFAAAVVLLVSRLFLAGQWDGFAASAEVSLLMLAAVPVLLAVGVSTGRAARSADVQAGITRPDPPAAGRSARRSRTMLAAALGVANLAVIAAGAMHILVWNPLARVPGLSLNEIYGQMRAVGEGTAAGGFVASWAGFWSFATVLYVIACALPLRQVGTRRRVAVAGLLLIGATCILAWTAGFNMGMSLADAFGTGGADAAISGPLLSLAGQLAVAGALFLACAPRRAVAEAPAPA